MRILPILLIALPLGGCVVRTAAHVATAPVRAVGYGYDKMTTSQEEADRNRGRAIREQEKREAKERRRAEERASQPY